MSQDETNPFDELDSIEDLVQYMASLDAAPTEGQTVRQEGVPIWLVIDSQRATEMNGEEFQIADISDALAEAARILEDRCQLHLTSEGEACSDPNCTLPEHIEFAGRLTLTLDAWSWLALSRLLYGVAQFLQNTGPIGLTALSIDGFLPKIWAGLDFDAEDVPYPDQMEEAQIFSAILAALAVALRQELASAPGTVIPERS